MKFNREKHSRRSIRLKGYDYSGAGGYFVTICTHNKRCILGDVMFGNIILNQLGEIVETEWLKTFEIRKNLMPDAYIIMPNHFHAIIVIDEFCRGTLQRAPTTYEQFGKPVSNSIPTLSVYSKPLLQNGLTIFEERRDCAYGREIITNILFEIRKICKK